jgi:hypothetical protein
VGRRSTAAAAAAAAAFTSSRVGFAPGSSVGQSFGRISSDTTVAVIGLVGIVLVPVITFFTTKSLERRRARDDAICEKRTEFHDKTIRGMILNLGIDKTAKEPAPRVQAKVIADITPDLILYASREVVLVWSRFRHVGPQEKPAPEAMLYAFEGLLRAMRTDLGHAVSPSRTWNY